MNPLIAVTTCHKFNYDMKAVDDCMVLYRQSETVKVQGVVTTTADYTTVRPPFVRETWWKNVPECVGKKFFYGAGGNRPPLEDEVFLDVKDDYASLPYKTRALCRWALDHGYSHVFKTDDDTYVYVHRLLNSGFEKHKWVGRWNGGNFTAGGPGYWLNEEALRIVAAGSISKHEWAEDIWVSNKLIDAGFKPTFDSRYVDLRRNNISSSTVAVCECNPEVMRSLYKEESC